MERVAGENVGREATSMGKVAFASFIGTAIEFYDFYIYGTGQLGLPSTTLLYCAMIAVAIMGLVVPVFAVLSGSRPPRCSSRRARRWR